MKYKLRRRLYSQNFLRNPKLVEKLIRLSSIGKNDIVIDIGAGYGNIASQLTTCSKKVIAIEIDEKLCLWLNRKFGTGKTIEIVNQDFLKYKLPRFSYKVFANIPFKITADIIKKITSDIYFQEGYLIIQKEAAKKFIGKPYDTKNSMASSLLKPWFNVDIFWEFKRSDFVPHPSVDIVMIKIKRRTIPLVPWTESQKYKDFILYSYNRKRKFAKLDIIKIIELFDNYSRYESQEQKEKITREARKILNYQINLEKIHRTRTDRNWRKFRK